MAKQQHYEFPSTGNHIPEDVNQRLVQTAYGKGLVIRTRKPVSHDPDDPNTNHTGSLVIREVELLDWTQSKSSGQVRPAMLYTAAVSLPSVPATVGDDVLTLYGRGRVVEVRSTGLSHPESQKHKQQDRQEGEKEDQANETICQKESIFVVLLSSWRLAGRSRVKCFLYGASSLQVVRSKKIYEMTIHEKVEWAQTLKERATDLFKAKHYTVALTTYSQAMDVLRYVQHKADSNNHLRADLLVVMITCSNNAATCCTHVKQWDEAVQFAKNASLLIDALEEKKGLKIHSILLQDGLSDIKLFGEWRVKSCLLIARAWYEKGELESALDVLKTAHDVIAKYTTLDGTDVQNPERSNDPQREVSVKQLLANDREVKKLHATCKEKRKEILRKEKMRAKAMFASPTTESDTKTESHTTAEDENPAVSNTPQNTIEDNGANGVINNDSYLTKSPAGKANKTKNGQKSVVKGTSRNVASPDIAKIKKKVSFAENVKEEPDEQGLFEDPEVVQGLLIAAVTAVVAAGFTWILFFRKQ